MNSNIYSLLISVFICVISAAHVAMADKRPNVVLIMTDDHGCGDLGRYNKVINTPHIDQLATESVRFTQFYVHSACAPTRASLLTGRNNQEAGVWGVHGGRDFLHLDEVLLPEVLGRYGYVSSMMGKWHLGKTLDRHPDQRGFTEQHMIVDRLYDDTDPIIMHQGVVSQPKGWSCEILTDLGIDFMIRNKDQPFFLYMAYPQIHAPWYAPKEHVEPYLKAGYSEELSTLFGYLTHTDENIGRLLAELKKLGLEQDTIILYTHDNGHINNHERRDLGNGKRLKPADIKTRNVLNEKGGKGTSWEGGIHVPLFARYPDHFSSGDVEAIGHVTDIFPTILDLCSINHNSKLPLEGRSLRPLLEGDSEGWENRYLYELKMDPIYDGMNRAESAGYTKMGYKVLQDKASIKYEEQDYLAIRNQNFKFIRMGHKTALHKATDKVNEYQNIIGEYPEVAQAMDSALKERFEAMVASPRSLTMPRFPIGGVNSEILCYAPIELLGQAKNEGKVLSQLKTTGDGASFHIDILEAGDYEIKLKNYTKWGAKPVDGHGAVASVQIGKAVAETSVIAKETYPIGKVKLEKGPATLTLKITTPSKSGTDAFKRGVEKIILTEMSKK